MLISVREGYEQLEAVSTGTTPLRAAGDLFDPEPEQSPGLVGLPVYDRRNAQPGRAGHLAVAGVRAEPEPDSPAPGTGRTQPIAGPGLPGGAARTDWHGRGC